ncbi:MAG: hypothetical protein J0H59_20700 [Comamonadaceae bacterium]|nr:hypothetical protein [Comamonadaceae bacterium]
MNESNFMFIHGWVDDVTREGADRAAYCLRVRLASGQVADFLLREMERPVRLGDEVSIVVERDRPRRVLVLMDHATGDATNQLREEDGCRPTDSDVLIVAATAGGFAVTLGWGAMPSTLSFAVLFWLVVRWWPHVRRRRTAALVDYLMDREYCRWRSGLERGREVR